MIIGKLYLGLHSLKEEEMENQNLLVFNYKSKTFRLNILTNTIYSKNIQLPLPKLIITKQNFDLNWIIQISLPYWIFFNSNLSHLIYMDVSLLIGMNKLRAGTWFCSPPSPPAVYL